MLSAARIGFKVHRFEVLVAVLASVIVTITAAVVTAHLDQANALVPAGCFDAWFGTSNPPGSDCEGPVMAFFDLASTEGETVMTAMWVLPLLVGLLLGVPLVAGELETRTAETAWTLAGSRNRWLGNLAIPALGLILLAVGAAAATAEILAAARKPWLDGGPGWQDIGLFGPIVVARAAVAFGAGLLAGAIAGRVLPALTVAVVVCGLVLFVLVSARHEWMLANKQELSLRNGYIAGGEVSDQAYVDTSGSVLTSQEAFARVPPGLSDAEVGAWFSANLREVYYGVPASAVPAWERLEVIGLAAATTLLLIGSFAVVERRRPR